MQNARFKKNTFLAVILFCVCFQTIAQQAKVFKVRYQGHINGDMTLIANNIVNRVDGANDANAPYNEITNKGKLNDEFEMKYIDIDNDPSTFSSSSAILSLEKPSSKKIVYAGLYWSATYLCNSSKLVKKEKFKAIDEKREAFDTIKLKLPNQEKYINIKGELIFDGINDPDFKESAPYVLYADITKLVLDADTPFGSYTVANIKATEGKISGGVSAGWSIFFVYEDQSMKDKFITSYDGFAGITDKSLDIQIGGFQTVSEGSVNAKIACAALEGDLRLKGDQLLFKASEADKFTQLSNSLHDKTNIFNSSITIDNTLFINRIPNSANTLGFDSLIMTIDNANNEVIGNNTHDAIVRLKTFGDRFFMFFTAFEVDVVKPKGKISDEVIETIEKSPDVVTTTHQKATQRRNNGAKELPQVSNEKSATNLNPISSDKTSANKADTSEEKGAKEKPKAMPLSEKITEDKKVVVKETPTKSPASAKSVEDRKAAVKQNEVSKANPKEISPEKEKIVVKNSFGSNKNTTPDRSNFVRKEAILSPSVAIEGVKKGYYIIANVFAKHANAIRFVKTLKKKGIAAKYFINPVNHYRYVYVSKHDVFEEASVLYHSNLKGKYFGDLWIMTVNKN